MGGPESGMLSMDVLVFSAGLPPPLSSLPARSRPDGSERDVERYSRSVSEPELCVSTPREARP